MNKAKFFTVLLIITSTLTIISCSTTIRTTGVWVNREKMTGNSIKSVFIIAFTDNIRLRASLENDLADAAKKRGLTVYKSTEIIGPVDIKLMAPVKDVFIKKLKDLNCETIFTMAVVHEMSETKYVSGANYSPYPYGAYAGYGGYAPYGAYGGFGGYYGYAVGNFSTPGYYTTDKKYFMDAKLFDLETDELLLSIQSKADNPSGIEKASKEYTATLVDEIKNLDLQKK